MAILHAHSHRSARQQESFLAVKSLSAADNEDDAASWVERSRRAEEQRKREQQHAAARRAPVHDDDDDQEGARSGYDSKDLAGLKASYKTAFTMANGPHPLVSHPQ